MLYREDLPVHARWTTVNPKMTPILNAGVVLHDGVASPQVMSPRMMRAVRHELTCATYAASGHGVLSFLRPSSDVPGTGRLFPMLRMCLVLESRIPRKKISSPEIDSGPTDGPG